MKKMFTCFMTFLALSSLCLNAQTYSDDFTDAHDYTTGVAGTIWDGVKVNDGILTVAETAELTALNTVLSPGELTFSTIYSYFAGNNDNGVMLYKNVPADTDFDLTVKITGGTFPSFGQGDTVGYLMVGPIVRVDDPDSVKFIALQAFDRPEWGAVYGFRNINMDPEENWIAADADENPVSINSHPWMRLEKVGSTYTGYISTDGSTWWDYWTEDRPDMNGFPLQVGLYNATYTDQEGTVVFDDFTLQLPVNSVATISKSEMKVYYSYVSNSIVIESLNEANVITELSLVNMAGQVLKAVTNFSGESFNVSEISNGLYIVVARTEDGSMYSKKVVIYH